MAGIFSSIHELWSLPLSICICFALLYQKIKMAFLAGVVVIVLMIPVNSYIAKKIGSSTKNLLIEKDSRVKIVNESLMSIASLKMTGLDDMAHNLSSRYRLKELYYLAQKKYLDAVSRLPRKPCPCTISIRIVCMSINVISIIVYVLYCLNFS